MYSFRGIVWKPWPSGNIPPSCQSMLLFKTGSLSSFPSLLELKKGHLKTEVFDRTDSQVKKPGENILPELWKLRERLLGPREVVLLNRQWHSMWVFVHRRFYCCNFVPMLTQLTGFQKPMSSSVVTLQSALRCCEDTVDLDLRVCRQFSTTCWHFPKTRTTGIYFCSWKTQLVWISYPHYSVDGCVHNSIFKTAIFQRQ